MASGRPPELARATSVSLVEDALAEIDIKRKAPSIWPWIAALALAAVIAVIWIWAAAGDRDERPQEQAVVEPAERPAGTNGVAAPAGALGDYVDFARTPEGGDQRGDMGPGHEYTAERIRKLAAALESQVERTPGAEARASFDRFREVADRIQRDPASGMHATLVREAFVRAAEVIDSFENAPQTDDLRATAGSIDPDQPLLDQREKVHNFFRQSAEALQATART